LITFLEKCRIIKIILITGDKPIIIDKRKEDEVEAQLVA